MAARPTIHWVSPLPPSETDIAHYTARILPALSQVAEVILWTDALDWDFSLERYCSIQHFDPDTVTTADFTAARRGQGVEMIFIHIGNSWVYHAGLMRLALRFPAIIVLHDLAIQELMTEAIKYDEWDADAYMAGMKRWYGDEGAHTGQGCLNNSAKAAEISNLMPGFELVMERARAVLTHTAVAHDSVAARLPHIACHLLPLPYEISSKSPQMRTQNGSLRLLQFGWIGPNRRLEQVLDTLAGMGKDFDYRFDVIGKIWNPDIIYKKISDLALEERVHLHGFVPEEVLDDMLQQAHLVLNLRHPSMGEASGSQLRIWNAGAASVVTREGWYASLPDDVAYSIDLEEEGTQLHELFKNIAEDRCLLSTMSQSGHVYLKTHHAPTDYAAAVIALVHDVAGDAKRLLIQNSITRLEGRGPLSDAQRARLADQSAT